jgi:hypothetical protein
MTGLPLMSNPALNTHLSRGEGECADDESGQGLETGVVEGAPVTVGRA